MEDNKKISTTERYNRVPGDRINKLESKVFTLHPTNKGEGKTPTPVKEKTSEASAKLNKTPETILKEKYSPKENLAFLSNLKYNLSNVRNDINPVVISQMQNNKLERANFMSKFYKVNGIGMGIIGIGALILAGAWPITLLMGGIIAGVFMLHTLAKKFSKRIDSFRNSIASKVIFDKHRADRIRMNMIEKCMLATDKASKIIANHENQFAKCTTMDQMINAINQKHTDLVKVTEVFYKQAKKLGDLILKTTDPEIKASYIDTLNFISSNIESLEKIKENDQQILAQVKQEVKEIALADLEQKIKENQSVNNLDKANEEANAMVDDIFNNEVVSNIEKPNLTPNSEERKALGMSEADIESVFDDLSKEEFEPTTEEPVITSVKTQPVTTKQGKTVTIQKDDELNL